jgi:hypothetical protein
MRDLTTIHLQEIRGGGWARTQNEDYAEALAKATGATVRPEGFGWFTVQYENDPEPEPSEEPLDVAQTHPGFDPRD